VRLHLRNIDAILPIDVKGKPSERMGHKAIGPHPGAVTRKGSQLPSKKFWNLFFVLMHRE
jgi:hypothetical protein